jgi:drug/metabolite transporter (DMT)-like permease
MRIAAILLVALGVTFFAIIDSLAKHLEPDYSVAQIVWARYAFAVPVILSFARPATWPNLLRTQQAPMQIARGLLPLLASVVVVYGLAKMPLAEFTAISFAAPLFVVALSAPMLKERITIHSWIAVLLGFVGVLVIVRPGTGVIAWAAFYPLALALFFALYQITTRLVSRGDDPMVTLAWTIAVGLVLTTPFLPFSWRPVSGSGWLLLALSGVFFGLSHLVLIRAFAMAPAAMLTPFTYVQIVAATVLGVSVFGDVPDKWAVAGMALIALAGLYVVRRQAQGDPEAVAAKP